MSIGSSIGPSLSRAIGSALAGGASWSPLALFAAGEQGVWYDPSDFSSMFQDSAGSTPVTAVGQAVGRINDKSGNGNHATQATPGSRPLLQQDGAGKYYLDFDGTDDNLATAAIDFTATDKIMVVAGATIASNAAGIFLETSASANTNIGAFNLYSNDAAGYGMVARSNKAGFPTGPSEVSIGAPNTSVWSAAYDLAKIVGGKAIAIRRNAALYAEGGTHPSGSVNYGNYPLYIGRRGGTTSPFNGRIYQLVVRGAATADLTDIEAYVNSKTGAY